jgi:hypothetical protein
MPQIIRTSGRKKKKGSRRENIIAIFCIIGLLGLVIAGKIAQPLRPNETICLVALMASPVCAAILIIGMRLRRKTNVRKNLAPRKRPSFIVVSILFIVLLWVSIQLVFCINAAFDFAPAEERILPIIGSQQSRPSKSFVKYYYVMIDPITDPWLGLFESNDPLILNSGELLEIPSASYEALVSGSSQLYLKFKPGFLGIPWVVSYKLL